jgi:hypothetical protein
MIREERNQYEHLKVKLRIMPGSCALMYKNPSPSRRFFQE